MKIQSWAPKVYVPLVAAHLVVLVVEPARVLSWSYALVLATLLFTLFLCWRRLHFSVKHNRPAWACLLLALVVQTAAFVLLLIDSLKNPLGTLVAFDPTFYFCLNSLILTLAATYSPIGPLQRWSGAIDAALACVIAVLFYLLLRRVIGESSTDPAAARFIMWMFDAMALFVASFVTLRFIITKRADERRFYFVLLMFSWAEMIFPAVHNRFILSSESYVPEIFLDLPFVVLGVLLSFRRTVWFRGYRPKPRVRVIAGSITPFILSAALCLLALGYLGHNAVVAIGALILGMISYAVRVALVVGHHLALEDELRGMHRHLQQTAIHDDLTGLINRRGFYRILKRDWASAMATQTTLTIAMMDIDNFKAYNDTYGHLAGNDCLAAVSGALKNEAGLYQGVTVARYGGEEFAVLLSGYDHAAAEHILQRLRLSVEALQIPHGRGTNRMVTASAGIAASAEGHYVKIEPLLDAADAALYAAKRAGRNCVRWFAADMAAREPGKHSLADSQRSRS
ncbi:GGDEF domain-containing protein [Dyella acidiphila]|uniref:diguanylate cyclase n=1 Tax=Dyella acidiphila TaxID=2775866 RepID=A0ABR9GEP4_9GAMM|nr:GGDEF domain-containing protein [Dyella acidiphila]MBE1162502.1 GGDEF domain-containing protein [Dyella acidiphila]